MPTLLKSTLRPIVHIVHSSIATAVMLSGLTCGLLVPILASVWIYSYNTGPTERDAEHVYLISDHSHHTYITRGQRAVMDVIEMMLFWAMVVAVPSVLANLAFEHVFPPKAWDYESLNLEPPARDKRAAAKK